VSGSRVRRILHLDVDAFLASVEQARCPELRGLPVVVGGLPTDRNLVMSCSYESRPFGVRPGMLLAEAARRCPQAIFRRGDSKAANALRLRMAELLLEFTPLVEIASIDDFFLDVTGMERIHDNTLELAATIRTEVFARLHLPLTVGISTSKLMARLAGKLGKPGGIAEIRPGYESTFLGSMPVEHLPGVGHSIGAALERFSIRTVGELRLVPREILFASFGRDGLVLAERACGIDRDSVRATCRMEGDELVLRPPKSIRRDSTFEPEEGRHEIVEAMLSYVIERAATQLRTFGIGAKTLEVRLRYVDTRPAADLAPARFGGLAHSSRRTLEAATDSTDELWLHARTLLRAFPHRRALVKRVGVTLSNLSPLSGWQGHLFDDGETTSRGSRTDRQRKLDDALDRVRSKLGFGRILRGSSLAVGETHPLGKDGYQLRTPSLNQ